MITHGGGWIHDGSRLYAGGQVLLRDDIEFRNTPSDVTTTSSSLFSMDANARAGHANTRACSVLPL